MYFGVKLTISSSMSSGNSFVRLITNISMNPTCDGKKDRKKGGSLCKKRAWVGLVLTQIGFAQREEACPQLPVGGDTDAVAVAAEGLGHRIDQADAPAAVGKAVDARGRARLALERLPRPSARRLVASVVESGASVRRVRSSRAER